MITEPIVKIYDKHTLAEMRERLAKREAIDVTEKKRTKELLSKGCAGWNNVHDAIVIVNYENIHGEFIW